MTTSELQLQPNNLDASLFNHTPFYCEENVYFLCKKLCSSEIADAQGSDLFVVFISNENKQAHSTVASKASHRADGVILWDYHVICVQRKKDGGTHLVWDLDSSLPFPCALATYVSETIRPSFQLFRSFRGEQLETLLVVRNKQVLDSPIQSQHVMELYSILHGAIEAFWFFRVVHAPLFLRHFASDRRHMKDSEGNWTAQPPPYEPIVAEDGSVHNLNEYMEIRAADVLTDLPPELTSAVFGQKHGVVIGEAHLEELFSQIP